MSISIQASVKDDISSFKYEYHVIIMKPLAVAFVDGSVEHFHYMHTTDGNSYHPPIDILETHVDLASLD
jgi:hypothetical protein